MEIVDNKKTVKLKRAKKRVQELKGFYTHLTIYLVINTFITVIKIVDDFDEGKNFGDVIFDFGTFAVWIFWGIGLVFHATKVFSNNPIFGKNWEEKQIQKYMEEDKSQAKKYR